jgi:hypothetical protein
VLGLVSGTGAGLGRTFARSWVDPVVAMEFVVDTSLLVDALACCVPRNGSRARLGLAPAPGVASLAGAGAPDVASRSVLTLSQAVSLPGSRAHPEELACWTGTAVGAKKKEGLAPPSHPTPTATASAPVTSAGWNQPATDGVEAMSSSRTGGVIP